jgi:Rax2 C-terminal beta propeller domain/Secretion system C-terminal sorting domain/Bacterial Ig domain
MRLNDGHEFCVKIEINYPDINMAERTKLKNQKMSTSQKLITNFKEWRRIMKTHWLLRACLSWLVAFALGNSVLAQNKQELTQPKAPLEQLLNRDGTLNLEKGFRGSLDSAGWRMETGPNGEPRFVSASAAQQTIGSPQLMAAPGDENWDDRFGAPGPNWIVYDIAVSGSDVYAAGLFATGETSCIAKWDGARWSALGSGLNTSVTTIAVSGTDLYAGGAFSSAGTIPVNNIAKWNGTSWSALGSGLNNFVSAIAVNGNEVYVGGQFTAAGNVAANYIAKWDGTSWSALGTGMNNNVYAIAISGGMVYAGGTFTSAGGVPVNYIAKWDGTNWSALGSGLRSVQYGYVGAIAVSGSDVYIGGGVFDTAGGVRLYGIAKWNGANWSALGNGIGSNVDAIAVRGNEVYAGGRFTGAGGIVANRIAKWDGTSWSALGSGLNNSVNTIAVNDNAVYAAGAFNTAGGVLANCIAKWDGANWSGLHASNQNGVTQSVYAIAASGSEVYAGGWFTTAGATPANYIAKWNGANWSALGSGMGGWGGIASALAVSGSEVYAGGPFTTAGGMAANRIAKWNGTSWSALGTGMNNQVTAIALNGNQVYVGGQFTTAGGGPANYIAKWDGASWAALGGGMNNYVNAIAVSGNEVYVGGQFTTAAGSPANYIAKWDGASWSTLKGGMNYPVAALAVSGNELYAGGSFTSAGGTAANHIAKWDGTSWSALGSGMNGPVTAITVNGSIVYAAGNFTTAGGAAAKFIAKWDGTNWSALGSGTNSGILAMAVGDRALYVGGHFTMAGGNLSTYFGSYALNAPPTVAAGGPYNVNEGASVSVTASGSDPENGPLTYAWDLDNNGSFETAGQSATLSAANLDGPSSQIIKVQVTDNDGLTATAQATVNVLNVAPSATFSCAPSTIIMGQSAILSFSNPFDPSAADVTTEFTYSYDCTNDGSFEASDVNTTSHTCTYSNSGTFIAKGEIKDKDGGYNDYTVQITVQTPQQAIGSLIDLVNALVPSVLDPNDAKPLVGKLQGAQAKLDNNKTTTPAINDLQAFINMINAAINSGKLTLEQGQPLIDAANAIIAVLSATGKAAQFNSGSSDLAITTEGALPTGYRLEQNSPNPFNPTTTIQFAVPRESYVRLKVYNSFGAEVATLVDQQVAAGTYKVNWDASRLASGFYLYRLEAEGFAQTKKLLLMK